MRKRCSTLQTRKRTHFLEVWDKKFKWVHPNQTRQPTETRIRPWNKDLYLKESRTMCLRTILERGRLLWNRQLAKYTSKKQIFMKSVERQPLQICQVGSILCSKWWLLILERPSKSHQVGRGLYSNIFPGFKWSIISKATPCSIPILTSMWPR